MSLLAFAASSALAAATPSQAASFTWSTGNFIPGTTAPGTLAAGDVLDIVAGGNKVFDAVAFTNDGGVNRAAGVVTSPNTISPARGCRAVNNGLWTATSTGPVDGRNLPPGMNSIGDIPPTASSFTNNGNLRTAGAGRATVRVSSFVNNNQIEATAGVLNIDSASKTGGTSFNAGTVFSGAGVIQVCTTPGAAVTTELYRLNGTFSSTNWGGILALNCLGACSCAWRFRRQRAEAAGR